MLTIIFGHSALQPSQSPTSVIEQPMDRSELLSQTLSLRTITLGLCWKCVQINNSNYSSIIMLATSIWAFLWDEIRRRLSVDPMLEGCCSRWHNGAMFKKQTEIISMKCCCRRHRRSEWEASCSFKRSRRSQGICRRYTVHRITFEHTWVDKGCTMLC